MYVTHSRDDSSVSGVNSPPIFNAVGKLRLLGNNFTNECVILLAYQIYGKLE